MFDRIAPHYDRANDFMSLGLHHGWREALIDVLDVQKSDRALDLATGTADVAILQGNAARRSWVWTLHKTCWTSAAAKSLRQGSTTS